ncbi:unnamed protein product [Cylicocyclus nassatus]|uniref:Uncharacterized protein n=1 Tax=Cylicocyclus nassatus TaxID=53992 RepID=A0AA36GRM0_CYLNA|nr:unnamed protein product [Cylicocyclus nassatus]
MVTTNAAGRTEVHEMNGGDLKPDLAYFPCIEKDCKYIGPNAAALRKHCERCDPRIVDHNENVVAWNFDMLKSSLLSVSSLYIEPFASSSFQRTTLP